MPLYDFKCPKCGLEFEVSRPMSRATDPVACPQDGSDSERVFRAPMTFVRGGTAALESEPSAPAGGLPDVEHGHSHGPGGGHSH